MSVPDGVNRRAVMSVAGMGLLLAGCSSSSSDTSSSSSTSSAAATSAAATSAAATSAAATESTATAGTSEVIAKTADVPVGGGIITDSYAVTQPEAGTYKAFSNICTHQGCKVAEVADKVIKCNCHHSTFDIATGEPTGGPAKTALAETATTVSDGNIVKA